MSDTFVPYMQAAGNYQPAYPEGDGALRGLSLVRAASAYVGPDSPKPKPKPHTACMFERPDGALCRGPRAKGTDYCVGHLRSLAKREEARESE